MNEYQSDCPACGEWVHLAECPTLIVTAAMRREEAFSAAMRRYDLAAERAAIDAEVAAHGHVHYNAASAALCRDRV